MKEQKSWLVRLGEVMGGFLEEETILAEFKKMSRIWAKRRRKKFQATEMVQREARGREHQADGRSNNFQFGCQASVSH